MHLKYCQVRFQQQYIGQYQRPSRRRDHPRAGRCQHRISSIPFRRHRKPHWRISGNGKEGRMLLQD